MAEKMLRSEQVYEEIKALIMSMELRPGEGGRDDGDRQHYNAAV